MSAAQEQTQMLKSHFMANTETVERGRSSRGFYFIALNNQVPMKIREKYVNLDEFIKTYLGAGYDVIFFKKIYLGYHGNQRPKKIFTS